MRTRRFVIVITHHAARKMHNDFKAILLKATQTLAQIFQLYGKTCTTSAAAGKGHIACVLRIIHKFALTAIKGMGTIVATATLLHLLALNNYDQLTHFTMP